MIDLGETTRRPRPSLRWGAVVGAVVARMAVGAAFYSPVGFVRAWSRMTGVSDQKMAAHMATWITVDLVGAFVMACVLAASLFYAGAKTLPRALVVAFVSWLGFVAVAMIPRVTYEKSPLALFAINAGFQLASMLAMAAILNAWAFRWTESQRRS
jgi:hypothetical protein